MPGGDRRGSDASTCDCKIIHRVCSHCCEVAFLPVARELSDQARELDEATTSLVTATTFDPRGDMAARNGSRAPATLILG